MKYDVSITLFKYGNRCQIYRAKAGNKFYKGFSQASRSRLIKLAGQLPYKINKTNSDYYFWSN